MNEERVVLVDNDDHETGTEEKMKAHQKALLHRAFSVFIFSKKGQMLLQRRAAAKYHCGGLWTNACCSHPRPGETVEAAAHRKLRQEMGFDVPLKEIFSFIYRAEFSNGLTEHELDHVLVGVFGGDPKPNIEEADDFEWVDTDWLSRDASLNPAKYTPWFRTALERVLELNGKKKK
jgi:isopentenyl-diphosphate delta-isomerase